VTAFAAWLLVALGFGVVVARRRSVAAGLVTAQALVLAGVALGQAGTGSDLVAALTLAARAVALAALFGFVVSRTREPRPVRAHLRPTQRAGAAVVLALLLAGLVPAYGLTSHESERAVLVVVACGLTCVATRRATVFQVLGIVLIENGLALAALESPHGSSVVIELGVTLDLTLLVCVAVLFHLRIFTEFGAGDVAAMRSLRD
jgi:hydrogenase-4 component E